jgi:hypothetical protein
MKSPCVGIRKSSLTTQEFIHEALPRKTLSDASGATLAFVLLLISIWTLERRKMSLKRILWQAARAALAAFLAAILKAVSPGFPPAETA